MHTVYLQFFFISKQKGYIFWHHSGSLMLCFEFLLQDVLTIQCGLFADLFSNLNRCEVYVFFLDTKKDSLIQEILLCQISV